MNYKILVVDDDPINIEIIIHGLLDKKYNILIATNGKEGCEIAFQHLPNLIIMDWAMPDMDGIEAIRILKANEKTHKIPIIMATGVMLTSKDLKTALEAGAIDYIRKPIDSIELQARVHSAIILFEEMKKNVELETQIILKEKQQAEKDLVLNKKALAKLTLRIIQNNELNSRLFEELYDISTNCNLKGKMSLNRLISNFKTDSKNINWQEFDLLFEQVYRNFYNNLNAKFPNLTANERKLCIFYKLNMTSKEICSLTLQTENALKKARARLRKKLKLTSKQSIIKFMQQFA